MAQPLDIISVSLDFNRKFLNEIPTVQGDTGRAIEFTIMKNSKPIDLTGEEIKIFGIKPDGNRIFNNATITSAATGKCLVELTPQMLAVAGTVYCNLARFKGGKRFSSMKFEIFVDENVADELDIESTSEYSALTDTLDITKENLNTKVTEVVNQMLADGDLANMTIQDGSITASKLSFLSKGGNLIEGSDFTNGIVISATGVQNDNASYCSSTYIPVEANTDYISSSYLFRVVYFDSSKTFLSYENKNNVEQTFTTPANCKYIRLSYIKVVYDGIDSLMILKGNTLPDSYIGKELILNTNEFKIDYSMLQNVPVAEVDSWYKDKTFSTYGDSITEMCYWQDFVKDYFGFAAHNNVGKSGACVSCGEANNGESSSYTLCNQVNIDKIPTDSDVILVMAGTNDYLQNMPLGDLTEPYDRKTFKGAYALLIQRMLTKFPDKLVIFMTLSSGMGDGNNTNSTSYPKNTLGLTVADYAKASREVFEYFGVKWIDMFTRDGITPFNRNTYMQSDGVHPKWPAYRLSNVVISALKENETFVE